MEKKAEVIESFIGAEAKHGEIRQSVRKDPKDFRKNPGEILKIAVAQAGHDIDRSNAFVDGK